MPKLKLKPKNKTTFTVKTTTIDELSLDDISDGLFDKLLDYCYNEEAFILLDSEKISLCHMHSDRVITHSFDEIVDDFLEEYKEERDCEEELMKLSEKFKSLAEKIDKGLKEGTHYKPKEENENGK